MAGLPRGTAEPEGRDGDLHLLRHAKGDGRNGRRAPQRHDGRRAIPRLAALPVYVLTADIEAQKTCVEVGFTGLLLKPVTLDGLKSIVG